MTDPALAAFCLDAFLLARFGGAPDARPDGRAWERAVSRGLWSGPTLRRQHAGTLGLFGRHGQSGAHHEIDGAGHGVGLGLWLEAKARATLHKHDVAVFAFKAEDLYRAAAGTDPALTAAGAWWPLLISTEPCSESVRRCAMSRGVVLCEPGLLPLPCLLHVCAKPEAGLHISERLMSIFVDLAERVCLPIQGRLQIDAARHRMTWSLDAPDARTLGDLLFVQHKLTGQLLDYYDSCLPGRLEARGGELADRLRACAIAW
jgi:hypothetical protein